MATLGIHLLLGAQSYWQYHADLQNGGKRRWVRA